MLNSGTAFKNAERGAFLNLKEAMNPDQPITELFTQPGCQPCKAVERKLNQYGIPYIIHDISRDENARERVKALGYTQTPIVIAPDGTSFSGLHLGKIRSLRDD